MTGSTVAEAYQVLLRAAVVINLIPFVYTFLALTTLDEAEPVERLAGLVGTVVTAGGIVAVFLPTGDVGNVVAFELKMAAGVLGPLSIGLWMFWRSRGTASRDA